jgi:hypothetical protein
MCADEPTLPVADAGGARGAGPGRALGLASCGRDRNPSGIFRTICTAGRKTVARHDLRRSCAGSPAAASASTASSYPRAVISDRIGESLRVQLVAGLS